MPNLQPEQASFLLNGVYLPSLQNEHRITTQVIAAIPAGKEDYRPDQYARPALDLARHIAVTEMRFLDAVAGGQFDFGPMPQPESIKNANDLTAWYEENFQQRLAKLQALSNEQLLKVVDFRGMFQLPAVMYLGFILHHTIHHRGQLSVYLRPMGSKVPAMYGESYDSAEAKKAQAK
jgi:uncharacterized damage-inducible protein DinB